MTKRPGGQLATRPLHFFWIADCSGSMSLDGKIQSLNTAIQEAIPHMQDVANENPNAEVLVRAIKFSNSATWHISTPTPVANFKWPNLTADGVTDMGAALALLADHLKIPPMDMRGLPPVLVLISDGGPTDDFSKGLKALMDQPWGRKAVRIAIAIGKDAQEPEAQDVLQRFIGHSELKPLNANNADQLVKYIKWASTAVLKAASAPSSQSSTSPAQNVNIPIPAPPTPSAGPASVGAGDVW